MSIKMCNNSDPPRSVSAKVLRVVVLLICAASSTTALQAEPTTRPSTADSPVRQLKSYCGIRCLYAAAIGEGVTLAGADLVRPEYIGSREGSSIDELALAANEHGLHGLAFIDGTIQSLRTICHPAILHVESVPGSGRYDHFVLYLGQRDKNLLIFDPASAAGAPPDLIAPRDLELMWDGAGVIVSRTPINASVFAGQITPIAFWAALVIGVVGFMRWSRLGIAIPSLSVAGETLAIGTLALLAPAVSAMCAQSGLLAHGQQVELVERTHAAYFLPRVSIPEAAQRAAAGSAVLVDARYAADYGAGHLPGAINVPVTTSGEVVRLYMRNVRQNVPVIVYCQSRACPFAKGVATSLLQEGFTSVQLLDGGWEEWCQWKH